MSTSDREPKLIHVRRPLKRIRVNFEPTVPLDGPITDGPLIPVGRPLKRVRQTFKPAATLVLSRPLAAGDDPAKIEAQFSALVAHLNEMESLEGRAGVWVDGERSESRNGEVVIVLVPNNPTDALATCERVANILFKESPGITVKVFTADKPETPVLVLAA